MQAYGVFVLYIYVVNIIPCQLVSVNNVCSKVIATINCRSYHTSEVLLSLFSISIQKSHMIVIA